MSRISAGLLVACRSIGVLALSLGTASPLGAHEGRPLAPHDLWAAWSWDPAIVIGLVLAAWLYIRGVKRLRRQALQGGRAIPIRRSEMAYGAGWVALAVALVSPLHALGEVLFSAHMVQHTVLIGVAAPLLVLGRPLVPFLWGMPIEWRRRLGAWGKSASVRHSWRVLRQPFTAWSLHAVALWIWHLPRLYEQTLASDAVHALQHASFLGSALLFWWALIHGRPGRMGYGVAILYVFGTALHSGALGALLTFAPEPLYAPYLATTGPWGLTPLEDQQLAGLVMWIPAGLSYLVAALVLMATWLRESEWRVMQRETRVAVERH